MLLGGYAKSRKYAQQITCESVTQESWSVLCACHPNARRFLELLIEYAAETKTDQHWTMPTRLVQPFHWTCGVEKFQAHLLRSRTVPDDLLTNALLLMGTPAHVPAVDSRAEASRKTDLGGVGVVLLGGKIFTARRDALWCEAIAIEGAHIAAVGRVEDIEALIGPRTKVIQLNGRTVVPGFNDAHLHHTPDPVGVRLPIDPVADLTFREVVPLIVEAVRSTPAGTWIFGVMGLTMINDRALDRFALDAIAPDHPIIFLGLTNHTNVLNSIALSRLGIKDDEVDPVGGFFERVGDTMRVSGRINEYAQWNPQRCFASMATVEEGANSIRQLVSECLNFGITTIQNMSWTPAERYAAMLEAADPAINVRLIRFPPSGPDGRMLSEGANLPRSIGERISISGTKWILDGTTVERAAAIGRPYADEPATQGRENFPGSEVRMMMKESIDAEDQLLLHAIGTRAIETVLVNAEAYPNVDWSARGLRLEHGDGLDQNQIRRTKAAGITVVQNPTHFLFPEIYEPRFGSGTPYATFGSLFAAGVEVGIGSDGPLNPFLGLFAAVCNPARQDEAASLDDIVIAYTHGGAIAEGKGHSKGMLAPGYVADLAVLSQDIFSVSPDRLPVTTSLLTMVSGNTVYSNGEI